VKVAVAVALAPGETADGAGIAIVTGETVITLVPLAPAKVPSPEYVAVNVSDPLLKAPATILNVAAPLASVCCDV
jgi:hypothetical protein